VKRSSRPKSDRGRIGGLLLVSMTAAVMLALTPDYGATASASPDRTRSTTMNQIGVPSSPVGKQLSWLLGVGSQLPLSTKVVSEHFDALFLGQVTPAELNESLESLGPPGSVVTLLQLSGIEQRSLTALVQIGPSVYSVELAVDTTGLIDGLYFRPTTASVPQSWSQVEKQVTSIAPGVSFLAAKLTGKGTCAPVRSVAAETPRPLGSMFKIFVLGALANAIREHRASWNQLLTVTAGIKVGGSGTLDSAPDGTRLTVEQTAIKMISVSDNTASDMLLRLVTRSAVENQVRAWSSHASLDLPFLTVSEMFALKYHDFPILANHYLALSPIKRASYLLSTVDKIPASEERPSASPRDIDSIEWFASADDLCRAFAGLIRLEAEPGLDPIDKVLSTNTGGIGLSAKAWPRIWFKGGSEPGVLTLGYLARDHRAQSFVVIVLTEDRNKPLQESLAVEIQGLNAIVGAFGLLR